MSFQSWHFKFIFNKIVPEAKPDLKASINTKQKHGPNFHEDISREYICILRSTSEQDSISISFIVPHTFLDTVNTADYLL
jgi:hypothetical protein